MNPKSPFLLVTILFLIQVIARSADAESRPDQVHSVRGVVREISSDRHTALIRHDAIPNYMAAMTMEFNIRDTNELKNVLPGDTIDFRLCVTKKDHWIDSIRRLDSTANKNKPNPSPSSHSVSRELKPGDVLPDSELIGENGKSLRFSNFRGRAIAFTFIFTRCPLPDFCPRMGNNFAEARRILFDRANSPTNWQFLSISFDPEFDTPAVLSRYAEAYRKGESDRWIFAVASKKALSVLAPSLDLMIQPEAGGSISHNLRTVVVDPLGKVYHQFDGNEWAPGDLAQALIEAAAIRK